MKLPGGNILTAADRFGKGNEGKPSNVSVFISKDNGETWQQTAWVLQQYWSNLFMVPSSPSPNRVYLLGTSGGGHGGIKISSSDDGGHTWPVNASAMLFNATQQGYYATGATPTLHASDGRIYRAMELFVPPYSWGRDFAAVVVSADAQADLLDPKSWTISPPLAFNKSWIPSSWPALENPGLRQRVVEWLRG